MKRLITVITLALTLYAHAGYDEWTAEQQLAFRTELASISQITGSKQASRWMNRKAFASWEFTTNVITRVSYDNEQTIKTLVHTEFGPLADYAGLTKKQRLAQLKTRSQAAIAAAKTADDWKEALRLMEVVQEIKAENDLAKELAEEQFGSVNAGGLSSPDLGKETVNRVSKSAVYSLSKTEEAVAPGVKATCTDIEKARASM